MDDNYNFEIISGFDQYNSSRDKTDVAANTLVKGSKNVYKSLSGTLKNREGLKVRGPLNSAQAGIVANYEWETQVGTRVIRVTSDGKLSVEYDKGDGTGLLWYDLLTGLTLTRFIFNGFYFDIVQGKQILLAANGSIESIYNWEGGITQVQSTTAPVPGVITQGYGVGYQVDTGGTGYRVGDILTLVGGDGTAQVPVTAIGAGGKVVSVGLVIPQGSGYSVGSVATTVNALSPGANAVIGILSVYSGGTLTKKGSLSFFQEGFSKSYFVQADGGQTNVQTQWQFIYNDIIYSYGGGLDEEILTGITPDPSGIPSGAVIMSPFIQVNNIPFSQSLQTESEFNLATNEYTVDFLSVISNQLYIGSYNRPLIFAASEKDYTDFTGVQDGNLGTPFEIILDTNARGISYKNNTPIIFGGSSDQYNINITTQTIDQGTSITGGALPALVIKVVGVDKLSFATNEAPISQEFIDSNGEYIIWLGQDNQVHVFGAFKDILLSDKAPVLSVPVEEEFNSIDFTGGALRFIGQYIFITVPKLGTYYFYRHREYTDQAAAQKVEQIWMPPQISGISRFANIDGIIFGYSNVNPMLFQVFDTDQWHDDGPDGTPRPYECRMSIPYLQLPGKSRSMQRFSMLKFDKAAFEGYMAPGTPLYGTVYSDYQGATFIQGIYINGIPNPNIIAKIANQLAAFFYSFRTALSLGVNFLNENPLGNGVTPFTQEQDYLPKFRTINKLIIKNCFEYSIDIYSYDLDARWEILSIGVNVVPAEQSPSFLSR